MSTDKIDLNKLSDAIEEALEGYIGNCTEVVKDAVEDVSKEALKKLKKESPRSKGPHKGTYAKGWAIQSSKNDKFVTTNYLYGKKPSTYAVAHLLEFGHAKRNGGRVKAIPHIEPVNEWVEKELPKAIKKQIEGVKS